MSFTRRHYEVIAREIRAAISSGRADIEKANADESFRITQQQLGIEKIARALSIEFERDNPNFNRTRFLEACNVQS
jgi:hypothetical protein